MCFFFTVIKELKQTGHFEMMSQDVDEEEHSIEMHLPYTYKILERFLFYIIYILLIYFFAFPHLTFLLLFVIFFPL